MDNYESGLAEFLLNSDNLDTSNVNPNQTPNEVISQILNQNPDSNVINDLASQYLKQSGVLH